MEKTTEKLQNFFSQSAQYLRVKETLEDLNITAAEIDAISLDDDDHTP